MAVDLGELIEPLQREVTVLGAVPAGTEDDYFGRLRDAFWHAKLRGAFTNFTEDEGEVVPISGTTDLPREQQQLIVLVAAYRVVRSSIQNATTVFRAQAGPVEFETQQSAQSLREVLVQIERELKEVLDTAINGADAGTVAYFDAIIARTESIGYGDTWYIN